MAKDDTVPREIEMPGFARAYDRRRNDPPSDRGTIAQQLVHAGSTAKVIGAAALLVLGWTGGSVQSGGERLDRLEQFVERSAPILEALGRGMCLDNPARAQRDGLPCEELLRGTGYLTRPTSAAADGVSVLSSRDNR